MSEFKKRWSQAKQKFEADTQGKKPAESIKTIFGTVRKGTGIESALGEVDAALKKKHRTAAADALQKFYVAYGAYNTVLEQAKSAAMKADDDDHMMAVAELGAALKDILAGIGADLKALKEAKSGGEAMPVDTFLGDVKGEIETYKKVASKFAEYESKWTLVKKSEGIVKALTAYQQAASKSKFDDVVKSLDLAKSEADKVVQHCTKILAGTNPVNYEKAVEQYKKFIGNLWESRWKLAKAKAIELRDQAG